MQQTSTRRPLVLAILDGWGHREAVENNAIAQGATPTYDQMVAERPMSLLNASEHYVGLPSGQMGNSEVGHMNIGAGRPVLQDLPRIDTAITEGRLAKKDALIDFIEKLKVSGGTAHILGLLSPGGVHSHQNHIATLVKILAKAEVPTVIHGFLDGRDTPPTSALGFLEQFYEAAPDARFATISGRYFAMDRDKRWERVARGYHAIALGEGERAPSASAAIEAAYERGERDEFVLPTIIGDYAGIAAGDGILMANFRADRAREILEALLDPAFEGFEREAIPLAAACGLVEYSSHLNRFMTALFAPLDLADTLGEILAKTGGRQLRIAETEKYAHVTFFLNGGREETFEGEERILIPSPKVATYDLQPEMSAPEVTDRLVAAIESGEFDLIVCNYANGDMVGHSGKLPAAIKAVETLDRCLARLNDAVAAAQGSLLITADHGNCEQMVDPRNGQEHTSHTTNRVPFILAQGPSEVMGLDDGSLADVAPTILDLLSIPKPDAMTGRSLVRAIADEAAAQ
jgi:2,3-bisphosphoglycerate-independent phosphoglycerate mutase